MKEEKGIVPDEAKEDNVRDQLQAQLDFQIAMLKKDHYKTTLKNHMKAFKSNLMYKKPNLINY